MSVDNISSNDRFLEHLLDSVLSFAKSKIFAVFISALILFVIFFNIDLTAFIEASQKLTSWHYIVAVGFIACNAALSSLRLHSILHEFGFPIAMFNSFRANIYGHLAGIVAFQVIGQALGRSALLKRFGVSMSAVVVITAYERMVGLIVALSFAALGAFQIFGTIVVDTSAGGLTFIKIVVGFLAASFAGIILGYNGLVQKTLSWLKGKAYYFSVLRVILQTMFAQVFMLAGYIFLATVLAPEIPLVNLIAACVIVSFAAALPISFSGWGVRELSSIYALGAVGMSAENALIVSVTVGVLSIIVLFLFSGFIAVLWGYPEAKQTETFQKVQNTKPAINFTHLLVWFLPLAVATAIFFQLYLPTSGGRLNVNLADPFVLVGGPAFLILTFLYHKAWPSWRVPYLNTYLIIATLFLTFSFLLGASRFGVTDWAFINRYMGWFVLLGYVSTGALIVFIGRDFGQHLVLRTFVVVCAAIVLVDLVPFWLYALDFKIPTELLPYRIQGFAQDPNAFAFQMNVSLAILFAFARHGFWRQSNKIWLLVTAIILAGMWYSVSRAGFLGTAAIVILSLWFQFVSWKRLALAFMLAIGICSLPYILLYLSSWLQFVFISSEGVSGNSIPSYVNIIYDRPESNKERLISIFGGLKLFSEYPVWGAGLGAFIHDYAQTHGKPLVIHSTPVWFLAEFGLVGFCFFVFFFFKVFLSLWPSLRLSYDPLKISAVLLLATFVAQASVHDLFFQRAFWFVLGVCLVGNFSNRVKQNTG